MGFPMDRDDSAAAVSVAELIDAIALPSIEPLASDMAALSGFPKLPVPGVPGVPDGGGVAGAGGEDGFSRLDGVRELLDGCGDAVAALRRHQNRSAALVAVLVERMEATALAEASLLGLDAWQRGCAVGQLRAELALLLHLTEGAAGRLMDTATALVRLLPHSLALMAEGGLGFDCAAVIVEETALLRAAGIPQDAIDAFEQVLLVHAVEKTLPGFRSVARRIRERNHPETIVARTRRAYKDRTMTVAHSRDGMSWLSLYAPSPTIEAIWDQCTYTAQAVRGPHEDRTLNQLRADIAAALLLRQTMAENHLHTPPRTDSTTASTAGTGIEAGAEAGTGAGATSGADDPAGTQVCVQTDTEPGTRTGTGSGAGVQSDFNTEAGVGAGAGDSWWLCRDEPDTSAGAPFPDPNPAGNPPPKLGSAGL